MSTCKHAVFFAATLCALVSASSAASATPSAPHVSTPVAAPAQTPVAAPARLSPLQRLAAFVGLRKTPAAAKLPAHIDLKSRANQGTVQPSTQEVAAREYVFRGGEPIDGAIDMLLSHAKASGVPYKATFAGYLMIAHPGDDRATVRKAFDNELETARKALAAYAVEKEKVRAAKIAALTKPLVRTPPPGMKLDPRGKWEGSLTLITPAQLKKLPEGTVLRSISGREEIVGIDDIDLDTRGGFTAFGFELEATPAKGTTAKL